MYSINITSSTIVGNRTHSVTVNGIHINNPKIAMNPRAYGVTITACDFWDESKTIDFSGFALNLEDLESVFSPRKMPNGAMCFIVEYAEPCQRETRFIYANDREYPFYNYIWCNAKPDRDTKKYIVRDWARANGINPVVDTEDFKR